MKKALILADGSVDMALSLNQWLAVQPDPIDLTVVYGFALRQPPDQPLLASLYRDAKQAARQELIRWLTLLTQPQPGLIQAELLLGEPELVLTIHLLLRRYDYLLIDGFQSGNVATYTLCQPQITTQLRNLNVSEGAVYRPDLMPKAEY